MADSYRTQPEQCPRLQPAVPFGRSGRIIGIYCRRPDSGVRIPRRDEIRTFCLTPRWPECPGNRTHATAD
jgi:hypothetical protein